MLNIQNFCRFVPEKFEEIFTKHAKVRPDALTSMEIEEMILANRDPLDPQSWAAPEKRMGTNIQASK